jgi:hypothetical protein
VLGAYYLMMMALAVLIPAKKRRVHQRNKPILSHLVTSQLLPLFFISHQLVVIFYPILKFINTSCSSNGWSYLMVTFFTSFQSFSTCILRCGTQKTLAQSDILFNFEIALKKATVKMRINYWCLGLLLYSLSKRLEYGISIDFRKFERNSAEFVENSHRNRFERFFQNPR